MFCLSGEGGGGGQYSLVRVAAVREGSGRLGRGWEGKVAGVEGRRGAVVGQPGGGGAG